MTPAYIAKLDFTTWKTSVGALKIDSLLLETYGMASARLILQDSLKKVKFFEETFLVGNISMEVILRIHFLYFSNADIKFAKKWEKLP